VAHRGAAKPAWPGCALRDNLETLWPKARSVIHFLLSHPACSGRIGSVGSCTGGHLSLRASMNPEVLAGVCFYATDIHKGSLGQGGDDTLARMPELKGEMLMIWGRQDPHGH